MQLGVVLVLFSILCHFTLLTPPSPAPAVYGIYTYNGQSVDHATAKSNCLAQGLSLVTTPSKLKHEHLKVSFYWTDPR